MTDLFIDAFFGFIVFVISVSFGKLLLQYRNDYQPVASLFKAETSIGFNAVWRMSLAPVCIVFFAIFLYKVGADQAVNNIWLVSVFFMFYQILTYTILSRWRLINIPKFVLFHTISVALSFYIYQVLVIKGLAHLLPDEANLRTDLWLLIAGFFYGIFYKIPENEKKFLARKRSYAKRRTEYFRAKYSEFIDHHDPLLEDILLALMVYEDFNRPWIVRILENIKKTKTRGIMQVKGATSDKSSINMALKAVKQDYERVLVQPDGSPERTYALYELFRNYNPGDVHYSTEVMAILESIHVLSIKSKSSGISSYHPVGE